ncbi:MAG: cobalamin-dependent protein [Patescibacteria group bacterium]
MKIALLQPNADERYGHRQGYGSEKRPPETGLAILSSYLRVSAPNHEMFCLNPDRSDEEIARQAAGLDLIGLTDWFSNHQRVINIARLVKINNEKARVVIGGPNTPGIGKLVLEKYPFIDYVVIRDGEDALLGLANEVPTILIPNLWYRHSDKIHFTQSAYVNLGRLPLWDFLNFENLDERLVEYREEIAKSGEKDFDPWLVPPLTMFSFRGCMKAIKEGVCSYCTSAETTGRALPPDKFWSQLELLKEKYNAEFFYMADDIFPVTLRRMEQLAEAKPAYLATPMIRAYAYMLDFIKFNEKQMERMTTALRAIGVFNLFFGVESFSLEQITRANKRVVSIAESERVIKALGASDIKTTMAYLLGLPGETKESLELNLRSLDTLLATGHVERIYLSVVMALRGTSMFEELCQTQAVVKVYEQETGNVLAEDDYPDYSLLQRLGVEHLSCLKPSLVNEWLEKMITASERYLPSHRVGGFLLEPI